MNKIQLRFLAGSLLVLLVITSTLIHADAVGARPDRGRFVMPFGLSLDSGERILSFEDEPSDEEEEFSGQSANVNHLLAAGDKEKAWMLEPRTFSQLSSAGQRLALAVNGQLPSGRGERQLSRPRSGYSVAANPGDNIRVTNPALDTNFHTQSETSIAVNGPNIIISFNEFQFNGYGVSTDAGVTWTHKRTPDPPGGFNLGDGVVAFGPGGECYYSGLALVPTSSGGIKSFIGVAKSTDKGATFSTPFDASTTAGNTTDMQDKEWIAVDRSASAFRGNVYASWTDFTQSNGSFINFSRSTDGGSTFENPIALSPQDRTQLVQGSVPVVAPNGDLYVAFFDVHSTIAGIGIVKSTDGGRTFSAEKKVVSLTGTSTMTGGGGVRTNSFPSVAIDNAGTVHIVYDAWTLSPLDRSDIFHVRTTDGGNSFSPPVKLNDDTTTTTQVFPSIAAASDGTLGVKWWDRRNDAMGDSLTDVYMTISHDGGASFGKNFRISDHNWTFGPIEIGFAGGYHGDYDGIAADGSNFYLSWSDERSGEADAYFSQVTTTRNPNTPDFNISAAKPFDQVLAGGSVTFDFSTSVANGFSGSLGLTASPAVSGLTYNFAGTLIAAGSAASLTLSTSSGIQPGSYLFTVTASSSGLTRKSTARLNVLSSTRFAGLPANASRTKGFTSLQAGIKVDASGTIHLVFDDDSAKVRNNEVFYAQSSDGGRTLSTPIKIAGDLSLATQSTLALNSAGNPYVAFTGRNPNPANGTFATFVSKSTDHGNTFSTPVLASGASRNAQGPKIAVDKNGNVVVAFADFSLTGAPVFAVRSTDGGTTFSAPAQISQSGETTGNPPFVAVDSTGAAYVVYQDNAQQVTIKLAVAADGQTFGSPKVISDSQVSAFAPQIAIDQTDNVYVTFYNRFNQTPTTFNREAILIKSTDKGNTFGAQVNVSNNLGQSTFPSLIVGDQGRVSVAWEDTTDDPQRDVFVARSTDGGAIFGPSINLSTNSARSFGAFGGMDANGNLFVAWTDDAGANTDVYVASVNQSALGPPDFTLSVTSAALTVQRGTNVAVAVNINRFAGFNDVVTVAPPDLAGLKAKKVVFSESLVLSFKLKAGGVTGPQVLTFTGRDVFGRTRLAIFALVIQPAQ